MNTVLTIKSVKDVMSNVRTMEEYEHLLQLEHERYLQKLDDASGDDEAVIDALLESLDILDEMAKHASFEV